MININRTFLVGLRALAANKLRSALTILGIVIGVAAVVSLVAIGNGATSDITSRIEGIGTNLVTVSPARFQPGRGAVVQTTRLYYSDYETIAATGEYISKIVPVYQSNMTIKHADKSFQVAVAGVTPDFASVEAYTIGLGRFLIQSDLTSVKRVAVLGSQTASDLFGQQTAVGQEITINGIAFQVVGVLQSKGTAGFGNVDDILLIPLETMYTKLAGSAALDGGQRTLSNIAISANSPDIVNDLIAQIEFILRHLHKIPAATELPFSISSQTNFLNTLSSVTQTLTIFLGAIAAISLFVGGIGIMNIMLVSVTERTREIGLRKAVGARKLDILVQFLGETITLTTIGGVIGIALGALVAFIVSATGLITARVSMGSVLMAFSFAVAIGVFFGLYPAYRAAGLRPMEALRYE
jgi:putative ABC transport system permease protein